MRKLGVVIFSMMLVTSGSAGAQELRGTAPAKDGDSMIVGATEVRLFGIDAPEYRQTCKIGFSNWACGADAASALRSMVDGRTLSCVPKDRDVYGRIVAICQIGTRDVAAEMMKRGMATALENGRSLYGALEVVSKNAKVGIWASEFQVPSQYRATHTRAGEGGGQTNRPSTFRSQSQQPDRSMWRSCAEARAAGAAPLYRGRPGYNPNLDGDNDGIACEPYRGRR